MSAIEAWAATERFLASQELTLHNLGDDIWRVADEMRAAIAELEAEVAKRDETMTIAYRLWLQDHHDEVGDYLLPFSTDLKRRGGE